MALKLYLAARPAAGFLPYGHLFLILWDDETNTGRTIGGNQPGDLSTLIAHVDLSNEDEENNPDAFTLQEFNDANTSASSLVMKEITSALGDVVSAWDAMKTYADGLDSVYNYDVSAANEPIANSNAFVYSLLNAADVDPNPHVADLSGEFSGGLPGADPNNQTILGSSTPGGDTPSQLIAASALILDHGVNLLGRDTVDDVLIGTQKADAYYGEQEADHDETIDTVSYIRSNAGVTVQMQQNTDSDTVAQFNFKGTGSGGHAQGDVLFGIENLIGSDHADTFSIVGDQDNTLIGGKGDDTFVGGGGNDKIDGGKTGLITIPGTDTAAIAREEDGTDTVDYSNAASGISVEIGGGGVQQQNWGFISVTNDGGGGQDELYSIERLAGTAFGDTVIFTSQNYDGQLEIDGGGQPGSGPDENSDLVDLSALSDITLTRENGLEKTSITFKNFERLKGTGGDDTVSLMGILDAENGTEKGFVWADLGAGNDTVEALGRGIEVFLGAGDDVVTRAGYGTVIDVGTGSDTIEAANNIRVIGADGDDSITVSGHELTGGLRNIMSETAWTHVGRDGFSYALNTVGDLVIRDAVKNMMFVAGYTGGPGVASPTAQTLLLC